MFPFLDKITNQNNEVSWLHDKVRKKKTKKGNSSTKNEEIKQYNKRVNDYHVAGFFSNQTVFGDVNVNTVKTDSDYKQSPSSYKCMYITQQQAKNASFFIIKKRNTF